MGSSDHEQPPESSARNGVQLGCGALFGLVVPFTGGIVGHSVLGLGAGGIIVTCLASAALFGFVAWAFGDRFWERLSSWWW
jgi:hypothetical protein